LAIERNQATKNRRYVTNGNILLGHKHAHVHGDAADHGSQLSFELH
jgi:hypothetical protein